MKGAGYRGVAGLAVAASLAAPGVAQGATTLGQTGPTGPGACGGGSPAQTIAQVESVAPSYTLPADGVITSWSHQGHPAGNTNMRLKIYRPTADQFEFVVVGESSFESISPGILNSFPTRVPARAGDVLGFSVTAGSNGCVFSSVNIGDVYQGASGDPPVGSSARLTGPSGGVRLNISAVLEPDADGDGFGDESQDACPAEAGPDDGCDPPETSITSGPKEKTRRKRARFEFTSDEPGSSFQCAVDEQALKAPCTSPYTVKVKKGKHTFQVRATDPAGGVDATPASDTWKVKKKKKKKKKK